MEIGKKLFGGAFRVSGEAMDLLAKRQGLIQSNIANIDTPGYHVQELPFAKVMAATAQNRGQLARTDNRHLQLDPVAMGKSLGVRSERRPVDIDDEMFKLSENQLHYQVAAKIIAKKIEGMRYAIDEGGK